MARQTAATAAATGLKPISPRETPIATAMRLPPITDQGWAKGLEGAANSSTADAPAGATMCRVTGPPNSTRPIATIGSTTSPTPTTARSHCLGVIPSGAGRKERNQSVRRSCMGSAVPEGRTWGTVTSRSAPVTPGARLSQAVA